MHRIDASGATVNNTFTNGDPVLDIPATVVDADWLNSVQEELCKIVEAFGGTLADGDNTQLYTVLQALALKSKLADLSGVTDVPAARTQLGIKSAALQALATNAEALAGTGNKVVSAGTNAFAAQPTMTGSATFTRTTNNIQLTGVQTKLALEQGDVIEVSGSVSNDYLFTVESITNANNIIVNEAHKNGAGPLSLTNETGSVTVTRVAKWHSAAPGIGQAWVDVLSARATNGQESNATGRSIIAAIYVTSVGYFYVNGLDVTSMSSEQNDQTNIEITIPRGATYKITTSFGAWSELR